MNLSNSVRDQVIKWNQDKAKRAKTPEDKARYEENIRNLSENEDA